MADILASHFNGWKKGNDKTHENAVGMTDFL